MQIGCVLASVIAATLAGANGDGEKLLSVIAAVSAFNIAAERANAAPEPTGPASWAVRFVDALAQEPGEWFVKDVRIEEISL